MKCVQKICVNLYFKCNSPMLIQDGHVIFNLTSSLQE